MIFPFILSEFPTLLLLLRLRSPSTNVVLPLRPAKDIHWAQLQYKTITFVPIRGDLHLYLPLPARREGPRSGLHPGLPLHSGWRGRREEATAAAEDLAPFG